MINRDEIVKKLIEIIGNIIGSHVNKTTLPKETERWDSLNHLNIILSIEEEFDLEIEPEDFSTLYASPNQIADYLFTRLNKKND